LYRKPVTGAGEEELLLATEQEKAPTDWSRDGKFLLYRSEDPKTSFDIWALSAVDRRVFPVVQTENEERDGQFSQDGRWIAYQSNESGRFEIWVRPFPGSDPKAGVRWQVSTGGGAHVRWRADGKELFFLALDGRLMAASIKVASDGQAIEAGTPVPLFDSGALTFGGGIAMQRYMVSRDGQRFLVTTVPMQPTTTPITLILNWKPKP
jgi:Tol biopolymer transport system component